MELIEIQQKRGNLHEQMSAILTQAKKDKRALTAEDNQKFDAMEAEMEQLGQTVVRMQKHAALTREINALTPVQLDNLEAHEKPDAKRQEAEYESVFMKFLRVGERHLSATEATVMQDHFDRQMALSPASGSTGGYLVPTGFSNKLEEARKWFGGMVDVAETITTATGNPIPWPSANDTTNVGEIIGPNTQTSQAFPSFGNVIFGAYKFSSKVVPVPVELLQDSYFNLDDKLPQWLGLRIARIENTKFTVGTGTNEPTGIVTAAAAAGLVTTMASGNTATVSVNNFVDLEHSVDKAYRNGAKYMLHDQTLKLIKKLVDSNGRSLWLPSLTTSLSGGFAAATINGYEYVINNDMPVPGAGNYIVVYGDLTAFKIRRVAGYMAMRLTERYADYFQVGFLCGERADSNLVDAGTHPVALLQNSAS